MSDILSSIDETLEWVKNSIEKNEQRFDPFGPDASPTSVGDDRCECSDCAASRCPHGYDPDDHHWYSCMDVDPLAPPADAALEPPPTLRHGTRFTEGEFGEFLADPHSAAAAAAGVRFHLIGEGATQREVPCDCPGDDRPWWRRVLGGAA